MEENSQKGSQHDLLLPAALAADGSDLEPNGTPLPRMTHEKTDQALHAAPPSWSEFEVSNFTSR